MRVAIAFVAVYYGEGMAEQEKTLKDLLGEALALRNLNIEKLVIATDIPERYLQALLHGDYKKLPPAPYVRSYLMKIAEVTNAESAILWNAYKREYPIKTSGIQDRLPNNRFAMRSFRKGTILLAILIVAVVGYGVIRIDDFLGAPTIDIVNPVNNAVVNSAAIKVTGEINPRDKLIINNEEILVEEHGGFEKQFTLQPGVNTIEFKVKRLLGKETRVIRQVIYQP